MLIREAREGDAAVVTALWTEAYSGRHSEGRQAPYEESSFFASLRDARVWVAVEGSAEAVGIVVGVVTLKPAGSPAGSIALAGEAEFGRLAVSEAVRGRGTGRALVEHTIEQGRGWEVDAIALWSRPYQTAAHRIYESLGFRRVPARDTRDAEGRCWVFVLDL